MNEKPKPLTDEDLTQILLEIVAGLRRRHEQGDDFSGLAARLIEVLADRDEPWRCRPESPKAILRSVLSRLYQKTTRPRTGRVRWGTLIDLINHGSTVSAQILEDLGLDPHEMVVRRKGR